LLPIGDSLTMCCTITRLTVKDYKQNRKTKQTDIIVDGKIVVSVVYKPNDPLSCGAKCWVETEHQVVTK